MRKSLFVGSVLFSSGFALASVGVMQHNLPLLYAGNLLTGTGVGICYTPPIQVIHTRYRGDT